MNDADRLARVALSRLAEPGDPRLGELVAQLGAVTVRDHLAAERDLRGLKSDVAMRLDALDPARDLEQATRRGIRFVIPGDEEWPTALDDLEGVQPLHSRGGIPIGLWVRGTRQLTEVTRAVAVVGSRSCTTYGADVAAGLASEVASAGFTVVSGAAFGIDQAAHRGALAGAADSFSTVAVLACGVDRAYPAAARRMLDYIAEVGAVVSEAPPGCAPMRLRFLARNRLIAALGSGTVVVEAGIRSGALNTASWAALLNRAVMGVPGPVTSAPSQGVHEVIRSGAATLVTNGGEVLEIVGRAGEHLQSARRAPERARDRLTRRQQQVLDAVPAARAAPVEAIARTAGIGFEEVRQTLVALGERSLVEECGTGWSLRAAAQS